MLRELAGNPLLLTLMAVLARESDLPRDLGSLYKQAADLLLKTWDARRYLATEIDQHATRRLSGGAQGSADVRRDPPQVFPLDVGRQAHQSAHVVAIVLPGHFFLANPGHVAQEELSVVPPLDRDQADLIP